MKRILIGIVSAVAFGATLVPLAPAAEAYGYRRGYYGCYGCYRYYRGYPYGWRSGYWWRGWSAGMLSWWWVAGGYRYPYPAPVYPYPAYPYPYPAYGPPAVVVVPRGGPPPGYYRPAPAVQNWYYCRNPRGYYPYVRTCNGPWRAVPAAPPSTR